MMSISHRVWLCFRSARDFRDVEEMLAMRLFVLIKTIQAVVRERCSFDRFIGSSMSFSSCLG